MCKMLMYVLFWGSLSVSIYDILSLFNLLNDACYSLDLDCSPEAWMIKAQSQLGAIRELWKHSQVGSMGGFRGLGKTLSKTWDPGHFLCLRFLARRGTVCSAMCPHHNVLLQAQGSKGWNLHNCEPKHTTLLMNWSPQVLLTVTENWQIQCLI